MRVALTGCEGFLGSEIAKSLSLDPSIELVQNDIDIARDERGRYEEYNIGAGEGHSVKEVLEMFRIVLGRDIDVKTVHSTVADAMPTWSVLDIAKARDKLDWTPQVKLIDGIRDIVSRNAII